MGSTKRFIILIILILAGESIFFLPFVFARVFRVTLLEVYSISNLELGQYFSVYGVIAMVSYLLGGPLADKFQPRKLIATALVSTALGGYVLAAYPNKELLFWVYGWWGFSTIFLFWAALIKATRNWGAEHLQGKAFGFLEAGRGFTAALIALLVLTAFSGIQVQGTSEVGIEERLYSYRLVMFLSSSIIVGIAILSYYFIPDVDTKMKHQEISFKIIKQLAIKKEIWLLAIIIICAYSGYKITDVFSIYAKDVLSFSEYEAAQTGLLVLWMRPLFAFLVGVIADKLMSNKAIPILFILLIVGSSLLLINPSLVPLGLTFVFIALTASGIYGIRAIYFALIKESKIPLFATGSAVGIISFLGYTPDVFMSPIIGFLIDNNPGFQGYNYVFLLLTGWSLVGLSAAAMLYYKLQIQATPE